MSETGMELEALLVAHLMLDRELLARRRVPRLSAAGAALVDLVRVEDVRTCILASTVIALRVARHCRHCHDEEPRYIHLLQCTNAARYRDVVRLAQRVERLTIDALSLLSRDTVLSCLGAVAKTKRSRSDRLLALAERETAA